jgi:hypothetical protein
LDPKIAANLDPKDRSILSIQLAQAWAHKAELQARVDALKQSDTQLDSQDLKPIWGDLDPDTKHQIFMNLKNQENAELQKIMQEKQANPGTGFFSKMLSGLEQMLILNQIVTNNEIAADQSTTLAAQTIGHKVDEGHKKVNQGLGKVNKVVKFPFTTAEKVAYKKLKEIEAKPKEQWTAEDLQSLDDIVGTINFSNTAQFAINAFLPESIEDAILNIATAKALGVAYKGGKVAFKASKKAIGKSTALAKKLVQNIDFNKLSKAYKARIGKLQGLANELSHKAEQVAAQIIDQMTPQGQQLATLGGNGNLVANLEGRPIKILHVEARSAKDGLNNAANGKKNATLNAENITPPKKVTPAAWEAKLDKPNPLNPKHSLKDVSFTPHNDKHTKARTNEEAKHFSKTGNKPAAQYLKEIDNKELEKKQLLKGLLIMKNLLCRIIFIEQIKL